MSITQSGVAPAGWYQSPADTQGTLRWWDGTQWSQHTSQQSAQPQHVYVHQDRGKKVNHTLHAILSFCTFGLWLPVWLIIAIAKN